ncbi:hypothetical protein [Nostoc sp. MG11]|uniref:hypothetical protein n=1 Tax=Nostoc sp. MG11 TaxID=2721166 RepID=UPI001D014BCE|nr:hypothetical protein [Nostoc sp. MG11]
MLQKVGATMSRTDPPQILIYMKQDFQIRDAFLDNLLSREEWAKFLGFHRTTLWRWEEQIINEILPLKHSYYEKHRGARSNYLDAYQRFLSAIIYFLKGGQVEKGIKNNAQVKEFLKRNFMHLRRKDFEQWKENQ